MPYNPCGAIVDWSRFRYTTRCRFFADSDIQTDIVWYPAAEDARVLPYDSAIFNREWDRDGNLPLQGEGVGEVSDAPRRINHFPTPFGANGSHQCGTESDFAEGAIYDPDVHVEYRSDGLPKCCPGGIGGVLWGGFQPIFGSGGVRWGGQYVQPVLPGTDVFPFVAQLDTPYAMRLPNPVFAEGGAITPYLATTTLVGFEWQYADPAPTYFTEFYVTDAFGHSTHYGPFAGQSGCQAFTVPTGYALYALLGTFATTPVRIGVQFQFKSGGC